MIKKIRNSRTKILKLRNAPKARYSAQDLVRGKQNGFIPMIIMFLLILGAIIWLVYSRIHGAHK